jgi:hypothetical protein
LDPADDDDDEAEEEDFSIALAEQDAAESADFSRTPLFNVFWVNRLVPLTTVENLPFFPEATTKAQCDRANLPEKWRNRVKGFLFFGNTFKHIANNKLRINLPLDEFLNDKNTAKQIMFTPHTVKDQFLR